MKKYVPLLLIALFFSLQVINAQNAPISTIGAVETYETTIVVPITVTGFNDIGGCDLVINYDPAVATATSVSVGPGVGYYYFVGNTLTPGQISITWLFFQPGLQGLTLEDNSVFLNLTFDKVADGYSALEFDFGHPLYCEFIDYESVPLIDTPNSTYYIYGSVTFLSHSSWTGNVSDEWSDSQNWTDGIPGEYRDAVITDVSPSFFPITNTAECHKLDIALDASVTVPVNNSLTVFDDFTNNGLLTIESTDLGDGSFINYGAITGTGDYKVERYLTEDEWHYVSSPNIDAVSNTFLGIWLRPFDETTYSWEEYITATDEDLLVMKGYGTWAYDPSTILFDGALNSGYQCINVTKTTPNPGAYAGYNLIGNPYPSALDWDVTTGWDKTNVDNTIYFWKGVGGVGGTGNYYYYNGGGGEVPPVGYMGTNSIIPAMQGFFVRAKNDGTFSVNNDARAHDNKAFYKDCEENILPIIRLRTEKSASSFDETIIRFYQGASIEHDGDYDAFKLQGYMVPQLYSITPEQSNLAINTYPSYEDETIIPLGFVSPEEGEYSISLSEFENFEAGTTIYLEDLLNDIMFNLSLTPKYVFSSTPDDIKERFNLHFGDMAGVLETELNMVHIYSFENTIKVRNPEKIKGYITVYNIAGQEVAKTKTSGSIESEIRIPSRKGYYLVKFQSDESVTTKKVFIE